METKGFIYKITNPNGLVYIGQTIDIERRMNTYKSLSCKSQPALFNSLTKYGVDSHVFEVLEETYDLSEREIFWINEYDSYNFGLNCTKGGDGGSPFYGHKHTDFSKDKIRNSLKGRVFSEETIQKLREANTGERNHMFGKKQSKESNEKRSNTLKGRVITEESKYKISEKNSKKIICLETGVIFKSSKEAAEIMNLSQSGIRSVTNGLQKTHGGYTFIKI